MKRRHFLKGIIGAPAAAAVTRLEPAAAAIDAPEPILFEYGNFGILYISVTSAINAEMRAETSYPYWDWTEECQRDQLNSFSIEGYAWLPGDRPTPDPPTLAVPVNELTTVKFYYGGELALADKPKWNPSLRVKPSRIHGWFEPWEFVRSIEMGAIS